MTLSYYDEREKPQTRLATWLVGLNGALSFALVFYWSGLTDIVGEPFKWAMRGSISPNPPLFEYPYLALWLTPTLCMCGGWLALQGQRPKFSRTVGLYPWVMLALMIGWYYLAPSQWR